jgi:DNA replication initiation complex subunit (GINS family)
MISYNDIYEAERKERYSEQLQPLPKNFVQDFSQYIKEKKEIVSKEEDSFSEMITKTKKQLENAIILFKQLMRNRRKKILDLALIGIETGISKQDFENMLPFEKELFEELMKSLEKSDKSLNDFLNNKNHKEEKNIMVIFKENVVELLDLEGNRIGPFEKGQIANIPKEIAKILIEDGKAEFLEEK